MSHDSSLEQVLRTVEPAVRLISERHLRQVLNFLIDWGQPLPSNLGLPYWVSREDLATADTLPPHVMTGTEPYLLLITDTADRMIEHLPKEIQLRAYWRVLFQAAVMREIDRKIESGALTPEACRERLEQFGSGAAREIRYVLSEEHLVAPGVDDVPHYRAFVSTYLDLATFGGPAAEEFFPSLPPEHMVTKALAPDVDSAHLLAATRPVGAADPPREMPPDEEWSAPDRVPETTTDRPSDPGGLLARAGEAEQNGNNVRAAIVRTQLTAGTTGEEHDLSISGARSALGKMVDSLGDAFAWDSETRQEWRQALAPLLESASHGFWPRAARCLYELQKIPADLSRDVYAIDLPESIRTFGRRPVKRLLPRARPVLILMSLKRAHNQMRRAGLGQAAQLRLDRLFHHQIHIIEHDIRRDLTPVIVKALSDAGLTPTNRVDEVARDKIVAELLDRICERGYLRIGNLRDAIARNRLKMSDLASAGEFFRGDALLRADINLAYALDGVYRKGEFYLRGIQRASSLFFGTHLGRLFTLYIALPFGGAFLALMFAEELRHIGSKLVSLVGKPAVVAKSPPPPAKPTAAVASDEPPDLIEADEVELVGDEGEFDIHEVKPGTVTSENVGVNDAGEIIWYSSEHGAALVSSVLTSSAKTLPTVHHHGSILIAWPTILGFGVFLLLMFHIPPFRRVVLVILGYLWWVIRGVLWDIPMGVWRSQTVRGFRQSRPVRFLVRRFWSPLLITMLAFVALLLVGVSPLFLLGPRLVIFWAVLTIAYNLPWGWVIQDRIAEAVSDWWRLVRVNLIPGLIATIIDGFKMLANWIERQLYAVDEWLRYRRGDSHGSLAMKAFLGLLWFPLAYTFRFAFYLLIEPQVNPVKHFPVVTVSHKVLLPMTPSVAEALNVSAGTAAGLLACIPGIFGFIAWELKENWRLYSANRSARLRPVMLGSHGESMRGLLRPGFHSGTVPKLFRKLRHADRSRANWLHNDLEHAAEGVHRFAERELIHLLLLSSEWGKLNLHLEAIRFGCQRLTLELAAPSLGRDNFILTFENVCGRIEADVEQVGWADKLTEPQRSVFVAALRGLLDMAAVDRIDGRERVEGTTSLGPGFADLARRLSWEEWVERWKAPAPN